MKCWAYFQGNVFVFSRSSELKHQRYLKFHPGFNIFPFRNKESHLSICKPFFSCPFPIYMKIFYKDNSPQKLKKKNIIKAQFHLSPSGLLNFKYLKEIHSHSNIHWMAIKCYFQAKINIDLSQLGTSSSETFTMTFFFTYCFVFLFVSLWSIHNIHNEKL